jgi:ABC-type polysaccharide/polyol phosphate export permease
MVNEFQNRLLKWVCYKQTVIGVAWNFLRPLPTMIVFTVNFGRGDRLLLSYLTFTNSETL